MAKEVIALTHKINILT